MPSHTAPERFGPLAAFSLPHPIILDGIRALPRFPALAGALPRAGEAVGVRDAVGSFPTALVAALRSARPERLWVLITSGPEAADHALSDVEALLGVGEAFLFPQRESLPYEAGEAHTEIGGQRVEALEALLGGRARMLVTTARAVQERSPAIAGLAELRLELRVGQEIRLAALSERLDGMGFQRVPTVEEVGQYALRGGLVDIFGFGSPEPARVEFWGDQIESIRLFDVLSQLSSGSVDHVELLPVDLPSAAGIGGDAAGEPRSVLDYLPPDAIIVHLATAPAEEWARTWAEVERLYAIELRTGNPEQPGELFLPPSAIAGLVGSFAQIRFGVPDGEWAFGATPPESVERSAARLGALIREDSAPLERTLILCDNQGQLERLDELLAEVGVAGALLAIGSLAGGFRLPGAEPPLRVLTDHEIFRRNRRTRAHRRLRRGVALESFAALQPGDYVVHMDHGVGQFRGMERVLVGDEEFETLVVEYAGGELLRVPVHRVDLIERWVSDPGEDRPPPKVHRIGGRDWHRAKQRTQRAIEELTHELLELYAARQRAEGYAYSPDTRWQREMESSFLFEDTPDQRKASDDVKRDMERARPMDRLVCGDVGYGKTEVAIRAAFKAVQDGKQVAVLVPTTILAEQHGHSFGARLADFPVRIEVLSRFRTAKETREVSGRLAAGEVDIVVGTHRLISPDIHFKDLGLIIVDEEHRFGVKHKEYLKELRKAVDVLTLTATPIPRTLHMAMSGLRDLSLIQTPPRDRQPIITHVLPWADSIMEDAMRRELDRGGQVFLLHNRIETIPTLAERVKRLVPDARIAVAHGQMREHELEEVMRGFLEGETDVLVTTAIIESGLDVPRANTLIVDRADQFGLAQLHQIRGRVGRSHHRAYCYLVLPEGASEDAERRLRVLEHHTELGSGYRIALKDLELRGAGNLLGTAQAGFVHSVGIDTYLRLLDQAVKRMQGEDPTANRPQAEVSMDGAALIPDDYVPDEAQKLHFYRRLSAAANADEVLAIGRELRDRFGPSPAAVDNLLATAALRLLGRELGLERVILRANEARLNFRGAAAPPVAALQRTLAERQLEAEVRRPFPLSLVLHRRGPEPVATSLVSALQHVARAA